ncbi:upstream stimulatory factor 2-like isoform X1 [Mercenaria mercenaria]|uniref:upstream stimulatory factor 2-like isoform X1 n=1 Tax=Mercenaria mercenaria TaxID=6596 RepID=UPI00234E644B|nr:upstream stimulatory factor 2-like isoform X1 [Mercenaria mercenaria]
MDILDEALDGSQGKEDSAASDEVQITQPDDDQSGLAQGGQLTIDPTNLQYQFRADTGQGAVTYRVVQVATQDGTEHQAQVVSTGFPAGAQAVIQSPFSSGSPTADAQPDTRFTYFPASVAGGAGDVVTTQADAAVALAGQGGLQAGAWQQDSAQGQFYVMMSPQDVLQGQRNIAPRTNFQPKIEGGRTSRDDRRRATHNEVERRRRDKINNWIVQLSKLVPDCTAEQSKAGQLGSKGGILSKACDYITDLRQANGRLSETVKETERLNVDNELLRQQIEELKNENMLLRTTLQQHGIVPPDTAVGNS